MLRLVAAGCIALAATAFAEPPSAPVETTEVHGDIPQELLGRWFAVAQGKVQTGASRTIARGWEIRRGPDHLELVLRRAPLPKDISDAIQAAGTAGRAWQPEDRDLRAIAATWDAAPTGDQVTIASRLATAAAFTPELARDAVTQGSEVAIVIDEQFTGADRVARTTSVYGVRERGPTTLRGTFVGTTVVIVFAAVPITFTGDFVAYRVDASRSSWFGRLFSGCRRD